MKRISFLVDNWFGDLGGKKKVILELSNALVKDYDVSILTIDTKVHQKDVRNVQENLNYKIKIIPYFFKRNLFFYPKLFFLFGENLKKIRPDLVICGGGGPHANAFFGIIAKIFVPKAKVIFIDQGNPTLILKHQNVFVQKITAFIYRKVNKSIAASKELSEYIAKIFRMEKRQITFVYNWINPNIYKLMVEPVEEKIFTSGLPIILTVCRLDLYQKDFKTLLEAFKIVRSKVDSYLVIIGEGPDKEKINKMIEELGLTGFTFMLGYKKNPYKYMKNANVFVLSSFHEGLPHVLIEAIACGVPVISSDCDFGPREIIQDGENGFLVPVGDEKKLGQRIIELLENENLRRRFIQNSQKILSKFTLENAISQYKKIIQEVLS